MTLDLSLGETEAMARKAARGAGHAWGMAEDAGFAVRWLCAHGQPGAAVLADLLAHQEQARTTQDCSLRLGAQLADGVTALGPEDTALGRLACPLLLLPFAARRAAADGIALRVTIKGDSAEIDAAGRLATAVPGAALRDAPVTVARLAKTGAAPSARVTRAYVHLQDWLRLDTFAQRTYAPETDASRQSGAGAGLSDND